MNLLPRLIERSLGRALDRQEFLLHYQPKVNLEGPHALLHILLQRYRSRPHKKASVGRRPVTPIERLIKPP